MSPDRGWARARSMLRSSWSMPVDLGNEPPQAPGEGPLTAPDVKSAVTIGGNDGDNDPVVVEIVIPWLLGKTVPQAGHSRAAHHLLL